MSNSKQIIKVVWICHFSNEYIRTKLKVKRNQNDYAPWITFGINEAKKRKDIELHIVSPHYWISGIKEFNDKNIHYHFFNPGIPFYGRRWPGIFKFDVLTNYFFNRIKIKKFIKRIKPDIVNLHGLENAYYSSSFFDIKDLPILVTIQGFNHLQIPKGKLSLEFKKRLKYEKEIIKKAKYFGIRTEYVKNLIEKYNQRVSFFWHELFINNETKKNNHISQNKTAYDVVFFARVTKYKGVEDLIKAYNLMSGELKNIKLAIIGSVGTTYLEYLKSLVDKDYKNLVFFLGFLKQQEIYKILQKSKLVVLPTYNDNMPGTIIESLLNKIAVLSYRTGGITEINLNGHIIEMVDQGNIFELSNRMKYILTNEGYRNKLALNGFNYAKKRWDNTKSFVQLLDAYKKILEKEKNLYI